MEPSNPPASAAAWRGDRLRLGLAGLLMFLLLGAGGASRASEASSLADREYEAAVKAFRGGRTSDAWGRFHDLANRGDPDAARIALFLHAYGPVLYGKHWDALAHDVAYWNSLVRNSGASARPVGEFQPPGLPRPKAPARAAGVRNVARN